MLKTNLSTHNTISGDTKIFGGHYPQMPPWPRTCVVSNVFAVVMYKE